jgi:hypothetical protein
MNPDLEGVGGMVCAGLAASEIDAKGYRTLPLLIARPGVLTRRYIDRQRTRYVSPLALFLFWSLLFTLAALMSTAGWAQAAATCVIFIPPVHMFLQLRGTYRLGIFGALWRWCAYAEQFSCCSYSLF